MESNDKLQYQLKYQPQIPETLRKAVAERCSMCNPFYESLVNKNK